MIRNDGHWMFCGCRIVWQRPFLYLYTAITLLTLPNTVVLPNLASASAVRSSTVKTKFQGFYKTNSTCEALFTGVIAIRQTVLGDMTMKWAMRGVSVFKVWPCAPCMDDAAGGTDA
jgi:hypothetical protein